MATLKYVGTPPQWDVQTGSQKDWVPASYITYLLSLNMTMPQVTSQINAALAPFATQTYANTQLATLATPAYVAAQEANYVQSSTLNQPNGPVEIMASTGQIAPGLINQPSTQQWPKPFWSPQAYNAASVTATTTPQQLYPVSIPDPGYTYVLFCSGLVDTQVATDNGAYAQIVVREGSTTGPIIAQGNGLGESYSGPLPGDLSCQLAVTATSVEAPITGSYATITGWTAVNNAIYTTTMVGYYMQTPQTLTGVTLAASVTYSGAVASQFKTGYNILTGNQYASNVVYTAIQIVDNNGNVIQTGAVVTGTAGTATVSWTGNVVVGSLYGVQIAQTGIVSPAAIQSGTFTLTPTMTLNSSTVNVLPTPLANQTHTTGATTLYVMLQSSDSTTQVTASTFDPAMWVMPIPWA